MSQEGVYLSEGLAETLEGNAGGPVPPNASNNIFVVGENSQGIDVAGDPGTSTLTITAIDAAESQIGVVELATDAEAIAGSDSTNKAIVPSSLNAKIGDQTANAMAYGGGSTSAIEWTNALDDGQVVIGATGGNPVAANLTAGTNIAITNGANSITIEAHAGSQEVNVLDLTDSDSPYTVLSSDFYMSCNVFAGALTIKLPNIPSRGRVFIVKDSGGNAATNNITVESVSGGVDIDGSTTFILNNDYQAAQFIFNGSTYEVY